MHAFHHHQISDECKKVWTSLRQQFSAFLRKLEGKSGDESRERPSFRHENLMHFVKDQIQPNERYVCIYFMRDMYVCMYLYVCMYAFVCM